MNCAVVGCGVAADRYAVDFDTSTLTPTAACDTDPDRVEAFAQAYGATAYDDLEAMLAAESAPLVVNLTAHADHAVVTRQCLRADRHVWSEKPLALDPETAAELVTLAERRDRALGCAPITPGCPAQRQVRELLGDGRLGTVRLAYAHAHVGRVTEWHDDPASFLVAGPLYDGAVYPLSLLVEWFGPVDRVRTADAATPWPDREEVQSEHPTHVEATLAFADGPLVRLTSSFYAPHRSREFTSLELFGDDGSCYLADAGDMGVSGEPVVSFGRAGRPYTPVPRQSPVEAAAYLDGPERLASSVERGSPTRGSARRAVHVVDVCAAIEEAAAGGTRVTTHSTYSPGHASPTVWQPSRSQEAAAICLPPIGFGCSRYRDDEYVDRRESIVTALDAGYRLLDAAELYGNEHVIGDLLAAPGSPDRDSVFLQSKVWNTNHGHVAEACETTLSELGVETLDCYLLHWPEAWAYTGPLTRLAERSPAEQEARTFPRYGDGEILMADESLEATWRRLESLHREGRARTLGICNVSRETLSDLLEVASVPPAIVQVERHPYEPRTDLVSFCHERGIRVVAHSPLSAQGLLEEPVLGEIAAEIGVTPATVVLAWNIARGVVPIPSSNDPDHVVENLAAARYRLSAEQLDRIDALRDPDFQR